MPIKVRGLSWFGYVSVGGSWTWYCRECGCEANWKVRGGVHILECLLCGATEVIGGDIDVG